MTTTIKLLAVFALAVVSFSQHTTAWAGDNMETKTSSAEAFFSSVDPSGCITTFVWVFAGEPSSQAGLIIRQYDACTFTLLLDAYGSAELADPEFQVAVGNLASATLETTVNTYDYVSGSSFDVYVDLTWTGIGTPNRYTSNSQWHDQNCHEISHHHGVSRTAEASGTISDGQTDFAPGPSVEARLYLDKYVDISGCKVLMQARFNP
jgi:hypothetical protein